jgi:peptidyl-prolyl cis-trans isomerase B (cyclophilin B)
MAEKKTNTLAIISFVAVMLFFVPLSGIAGFIMGIISLGQINESGEKGRGMAITAVVLGSFSVLFWFFYLIGIMAM